MTRAAWVVLLSVLAASTVRAQAQLPSPVQTSPAAAGEAPGTSKAQPAAPDQRAAPVATDELAEQSFGGIDTSAAAALGSGGVRGAEMGLGQGATESGVLSEEELEALGFSAGNEAVDTSLKISGFIDFATSYAVESKKSPWRGVGVEQHSSFYIGNLNLYLTKNLTESVRTMAEVRFLYLPNTKSNFTQTDIMPVTLNTSSPDYADGERTLHWGGVEIERVYLDWSIFDQRLTIRAGQFLSPYGIWNVDHGSPTVIPIGRPYIIGNSWFPERQTGVELFGRWQATNSTTLGYHVTLSNGTGPVSEYRDLDDNKAIGGRLYLERHGLGTFRLGASGYYGRNTSATLKYTVAQADAISVFEAIDKQYDSLGLAADLQWLYRALTVQFEWMSQNVNYTRTGRTRLPFGNGTAYPADTFSWGVYGLIGYRFAWLGVMPYMVIEYTDQTLPQYAAQSVLLKLRAGLNVRPLESVTVKFEYQRSSTLSGFEVAGGSSLDNLSMQLAWAF